MERGTLNERVQNIRMCVSIFETGPSRSIKTGKGTLKFFKQEGFRYHTDKKISTDVFINKYLFI